MSERTKDFQIFRIILIFGILCAHCGYYEFLPSGNCVPFFFILGGFLFHKKDNTSYLTYLKKKIVKFFPFYYLCLLLSLLKNPELIGYDIIPHLFLINAWIPAKGDILTPYVGGSWFLSSLLFCYICFPFLAKIIRDNKYLSFVLIAILIILVKSFDYGDYNTWVKYQNPLYRLLEYSIGYALFHIIKDKPVIQTKSIVVLIAFTLYLFAIHSLHRIAIPYISIIFIAFLYIFKNQQVEKIITSKPVLITASYTMHVYLSQIVIERYLHHYDIYGVPLVILNTILCFALGIIYERVKNLVTQRTPNPS